MRIEPGSGVTLSEEQLARVSEAARRLEASGASGLILIDDMALEFDVLTRTITGLADLGDASAVVNIDGVVRAEASEDGQTASASAPRVAGDERVAAARPGGAGRQEIGGLNRRPDAS